MKDITKFKHVYEKHIIIFNDITNVVTSQIISKKIRTNYNNNSDISIKITIFLHFVNEFIQKYA